MASESETHPATLKFQLAIPKVAQSISPTLAAIHVSRARLLHHTKPTSHAFDTTHCQKCGTYLLEGTSTVRTVRKRNGRASLNTKSRVLRRSCGVCGAVQDVPIDAGSPRLLPKVERQPITGSLEKSELIPQHEPADKLQDPKSVVSLLHSPSPLPSAPSSSRPSPVATSSRSSPAPKATPQAPGSVDGRAKARAKKRSGLQDMLIRSKERQEKERAGQNGGLAAFLQSL